MDDHFDDYRPLPPRRTKHGSKKEFDEVGAHTPEREPIKRESFQELQKEMKSRYQRRKALKEFTLNPQGYREKTSKPKPLKENQPKEKKIRKKRNTGLIITNIILSLFLLMIAGIFFLIIYYY